MITQLYRVSHEVKGHYSASAVMQQDEAEIEIGRLIWMYSGIHPTRVKSMARYAINHGKFKSEQVSIQVEEVVGS